jgi:hypothetical protein
MILVGRFCLYRVRLDRSSLGIVSFKPDRLQFRPTIRKNVTVIAADPSKRVRPLSGRRPFYRPASNCSMRTGVSSNSV